MLSHLQNVLYFVATFFHIVGIILLAKVPLTETFGANQRLYFMNISFCDILGCLLSISTVFVEIHIKAKWDPNYTIMKIEIFGIYIWYIGLMTLMTLDRFLTVFLNIRYRGICTRRKTIIALSASFLLAVIGTLVFIKTPAPKAEKIAVLYFWPTLDVIFLSVTVLTYTYFFKKLRAIRQTETRFVDFIHNKHETSDLEASSTKRKSFMTRKRKKGQYKKSFFTPTLLVANFFIFWLIPDQILFAFFLTDPSMEDMQNFKDYFEVLKTIYPFGILCDAFIYIFSQREILRYLKRKIRSFGGLDRNRGSFVCKSDTSSTYL